MKVICKFLGGSTAYGLNTPSSDKDERYLFLHTDVSRIVGLERYEHESRQNDTEDVFGWELRHFLNLLNKGNTMCLEMLYNDQWLEISPEFKLIQEQKNNLISSDKLFSCLCGYCHSERAFVLGSRTGKLGGKRFAALEKYGYSYKNAVQFLRLCVAGSIFFQKGYFPVNIKDLPQYGEISNVKFNPGDYNRESAIELMDRYEKMLLGSYDSIKVKHTFNPAVANKLCMDLYMPILMENKD